MSMIVWKYKKSWFLLSGGSKITWKPPKFVINHDSDHFKAIASDQNHFFMKYLTFWKGPISEKSKMWKFQEFLTFFQVLAPKFKGRGILGPEICFKVRIRPPAERNSAFFNFSDNQRHNTLALLLISLFFQIWSSGEKVDFRLIFKFDQIFQFERTLWN